MTSATRSVPIMDMDSGMIAPCLHEPDIFAKILVHFVAQAFYFFGPLENGSIDHTDLYEDIIMESRDIIFQNALDLNR